MSNAPERPRGRRTILIVTATAAEIAPLLSTLGRGAATGRRTCRYDRGGDTIDVLITGVGMVPTAAWTSRALAHPRYDVALNLGVCGSFDRSIQPGQVVHVVSDRLAEVGAEDGGAFLGLAEMNLPGDDVVVNDGPPANRALDALPRVSAITVNTVHGSEATIAAAAARFHPQVESMEGAAFMYACAIHELPFAQIRAVSNMVERRNRAAWKLPEAIANLGSAALEILDAL